MPRVIGMPARIGTETEMLTTAVPAIAWGAVLPTKKSGSGTNRGMARQTARTSR